MIHIARLVALLLPFGIIPSGPKTAFDREAIRELTMAAKVTRWTGAVDTDWETAGNWDNGQPSTGSDKDTIFISRTAVNDLTTNVDRTGDNTASGHDCARFVVEEGCNIKIGSSGDPLKLTGDKIEILGGDEIYLDSQGGALVDRLLIDAPGTFVDFTIREIDVVEIAAGSVNVSLASETTTVDIFQVQSRRHLGASAYVKWDTATTGTLLRYFLQAGTLEITSANNNTAIAVLHNHGGELILGGSAAFPATQAFLQTAGRTVLTGDWFVFSDSATECYILGGVIDTRRAVNSNNLLSAGATFRLGPGAVWYNNENDENLVTLVHIGR